MLLQLQGQPECSIGVAGQLGFRDVKVDHYIKTEYHLALDPTHQPILKAPSTLNIIKYLSHPNQLSLFVVALFAIKEIIITTKQMI